MTLWEVSFDLGKFSLSFLDLNITPEGIIERDEIVFRNCLQNNIPIMMVLSGGYQRDNAEVIAKSVKNLYEKFNFNSELIV